MKNGAFGWANINNSKIHSNGIIIIINSNTHFKMLAYTKSKKKFEDYT